MQKLSWVFKRQYMPSDIKLHKRTIENPEIGLCGDTIP